MKILFVIDCLGGSGKERQLKEILKGLQAHQDVSCEVAVLSRHVDYEFVERVGLKIHVIERRIKKDPRVFMRLLKIGRQFRPDVVHSWERMCTVYALPMAKIIGAKFINGAIRNAPTAVKPFSKLWLRDRLPFFFSDVVMANSAAGLESYRVPPKKRYSIHNGFDFSRISGLPDHSQIRKKFNIVTPHVVGMVGGFYVRKDFQTFLTAAMKILKKRDDVTFMAIGDGQNARGDLSRSTFETCKAMVEPQYADRIVFPGRIRDVESVVQIFDVGVLLTNPRVHGEGISNAIMEYMALGKPVIATKGGGSSEIVEHEKTGFLLEENDCDIVMQKIEYLLDHKEAAAEMGQRGREKLQREFNLETATENFLKLYKHMLNLNGSSGVAGSRA